MIQQIDEMIEKSPPRRMSLIGSLSDNCEITKIYIRGTVHIIKVYTDISGVRALYMKLTNGREYKYGKRYDIALPTLL